jgi:hypothetical protein
MKNIKIIVGFFIVIFIVTACKKNDPIASFRLNKYEYSAGDMISYENFSENFESLKWEILTEKGNVDTTFEGSNPNIILNILSSDGQYTIKLTAKGKKTVSRDEKTILVKSVKSYLNVNIQFTGDHEEYKVYVDKQFVGEAWFNGEFQVEIPIGNRLVEIISDTETYSETHEFEESSSVNITF